MITSPYLLGVSVYLVVGGDLPHEDRSVSAIPAVRREFRGVWVASVANIDWPSKKGLSAIKQKEELLAILDRAVELRLNAIVLQVRPMCDALYFSTLEPWSEFLTGAVGKPPAPHYDPLAFAVDQCHKRGLELHAWVNPYRAHHPSATSGLPAEHVVRRRPDLARQYGKYYWLDPGEPDALQHSLNVVGDIVARYDIDGMHIDDYFYPYKERDAQKNVIAFPDDASWAQYTKTGGKLSRDDWRRENVNRFIKGFYDSVKSRKPWVKVGVSPFGIWRPGNPSGIEGFDQYAELYADARLWLKSGWVDYFSPQLYWPIAQEKQSYPKLLAWWLEQNATGRHVWPGNAAYRATSGAPHWSIREIADQIEVTRKLGATGNIHFSMKVLMRDNKGVSETLKHAYAEPALVPAMPWLFAGNPPGMLRPNIQSIGKSALRVTWPRVDDGATARYVVSWQIGKRWQTAIVAASPAPYFCIENNEAVQQVAVWAVDRYGREGPKALVSWPRNDRESNRQATKKRG